MGFSNRVSPVAFRGALCLALLFSLVAVLAGCDDGSAEEPAPEPLVAPPVIGEAGVLRAGVDLEQPPFAGTDKGREAGIDIDVSSAIASALRLELETVQVAPDDALSALQEGSVDIVLSVPLTSEAMAGVSMAGSYITAGPAFFSAAEQTETVTLETAGGRPMGAQEGSSAYWALTYQFGEEAVLAYPTLRAAFEAAADGEIEIVGGDAIVGAYILRDFEGIRFAGQIEPATPLGVAVAPEATELEAAVREALDQLATNGALDAIRTTWVGDLPRLETASADDQGQ